MKFGDVMAEIDHVDDPDVLERMKTNRALHAALQMERPENWWGTGLNPKVLFEIARDDGIPVVWVPPSTVLLDLAAAPDHNARMSVLLLRKQEILDNCKAIVRCCDDPWVSDAYALTGAAIAAYEGGHHEAAMALAVCVSEPLAIMVSTPRPHMFESEDEVEEWKKYRENKKKYRYKWAKEELQAAEAKFSYPYDWQYIALIAPIPLFFTKWFPDSGDEPPNNLSRHIVAHQPTQQHFSPENALLSLMLATSLLYEIQMCAEGARNTDSE